MRTFRWSTHQEYFLNEQLPESSGAGKGIRREGVGLVLCALESWNLSSQIFTRRLPEVKIQWPVLKLIEIQTALKGLTLFRKLPLKERPPKNEIRRPPNNEIKVPPRMWIGSNFLNGTNNKWYVTWQHFMHSFYLASVDGGSCYVLKTRDTQLTKTVPTLKVLLVLCGRNIQK